MYHVSCIIMYHHVSCLCGEDGIDLSQAEVGVLRGEICFIFVFGFDFFRRGLDIYKFF